MSTGEEPWALPPPQLVLEQGSLHIWRALLDLSAAVHTRIVRVLSANERKQCERFLRPGDRARCAAARASLRIVLAKYLPEDPRALSIAVEASGKPFLDCSTGAGGGADPPMHHRAKGVQFNISHAGDLALIAVSRGMRVGIDVERIREVRGTEAILNGFFSEREQEYLRSREPEERTRTFFLLWTRREAAAKAVGRGLFDSFARFTLSPFDRDRSGFRVELPPGIPTGGTETWWMRDLIPAPGFAGALCVEQENTVPSFWTLQNL